MIEAVKPLLMENGLPPMTKNSVSCYVGGRGCSERVRLLRFAKPLSVPVTWLPVFNVYDYVVYSFLLFDEDGACVSGELQSIFAAETSLLKEVCIQIRNLVIANPFLNGGRHCDRPAFLLPPYAGLRQSDVPVKFHPPCFYRNFMIKFNKKLNLRRAFYGI